MGRTRAPLRDVIPRAKLDFLAAWCDEVTAEARQKGKADGVLTLRCATVRTLLHQARCGLGLATVQARPFAERSAAAQKAVQTRIHRARARDVTAVPDAVHRKSRT